MLFKTPAPSFTPEPSFTPKPAPEPAPSFAETLPSHFATTITYLDMVERPPILSRRAPASENLQIEITNRPPLETYRDIYNHVGRAHHWVNRRNLDDAALGALIHHDKVHVLFLKRAARIIGFSEVNAQKFPQIELVFLGLIAQEKNKGFGTALLDFTLDFIWQQNPTRVIIETNTLDDPRAVGIYQKAGFAPYKQTQTVIIDTE